MNVCYNSKKQSEIKLPALKENRHVEYIIALIVLKKTLM